MIVSLTEMQAALDPLRARQAIADGFIAYSEGRCVVPPVGEMLFDDPPGDVHIKYGYVVGDDHFVIKVATGFYDNRRHGVPANDGAMLVHSRRTGALVAVLLDRGWLTGVRTALAGAIVAERLAPSRVSRIGVLGTGEQARLQVQYLRGVVNCDRVRVWGRNAASLAEYAEAMTPLGYSVETTSDPDSLADCELIVTATPSAIPLLRAVRPGTHVTAVGTDAANKNEIDVAVFRAANLVVADSVPQCKERGSLRHALAAGAVHSADVIELGALLAGQHPGREGDATTSIADLTGVAVQDIKIAQAVLDSLTKEKTGERR